MSWSGGEGGEEGGEGCGSPLSMDIELVW